MLYFCGMDRDHLKGPAWRTEEDDRRFTESFEQLLQEGLNEQIY